MICSLLEEFQNARDKEAIKGKIAYKIIDYLARGFAEIVKQCRLDLPVVMSGGVTFNSYFTPLVERYLGGVYLNEKVPAGDNGISFGQIYVGRFLDDR